MLLATGHADLLDCAETHLREVGEAVLAVMLRLLLLIANHIADISENRDGFVMTLIGHLFIVGLHLLDLMGRIKGVLLAFLPIIVILFFRAFLFIAIDIHLIHEFILLLKLLPELLHLALHIGELDLLDGTLLDEACVLPIVLLAGHGRYYEALKEPIGDADGDLLVNVLLLPDGLGVLLGEDVVARLYLGEDSKHPVLIRGLLEEQLCRLPKLPKHGLIAPIESHHGFVEYLSEIKPIGWEGTHLDGGDVLTLQHPVLLAENASHKLVRHDRIGFLRENELVVL